MNKIFAPTKCLTLPQVQSYLKEEMDEEDRFKVENHLLDCPLCMDAVEGFADTYNVEDTPLLGELPAFESIVSIPSDDKNANIRRLPARKNNYFLKVAAIVSLLAFPAAAIYFLSNANNRGTENLSYYFEDQVEAERNILRSGEVPSTVELQFDAALSAYQEGNYTFSYANFQNIAKQYPEDELSQYYVGMNALQLEKWEQAETIFKKLRFNNREFYDQATWQLIHTYLKQDNLSLAKPLLEEVANNSSSKFKGHAQEVLQSIK